MQISRCDQVEELLDLYCRPSDEFLASSIQYGSLGKLGAGLTPADVHLNRLLRDQIDLIIIPNGCVCNIKRRD